MLCALLVALVLPAVAQAADPAAATISACARDGITVAGKVALRGSAARRARGAVLQMRFDALPLFGLPRTGQWRGGGKKTKATAQESFSGLAADNWVGVFNWRYKKGRKTVLSGLARTEPLRVGSSRGRASCTIAEGLKPRDVTAPSLFILPADGAWHHAPATVQLTASDDFSGVQSVRYGVDGAPRQPIPNGSTFQIPSQGDHSVDWEATDVAGNTATRSASVKVDAGAPTKPAFSRPFSVTASTTPTFQWTASTDSGSGMRGYLLTIKRADGSVAAFQAVDANTTSLASPATLTDGETYTATVTAVDNTADLAWTTDSDPLTFRVDSHPDVSSPQDGQVLAFGSRTAPVVVNFDRPIDKSTLSGVTLTRDSGSTSGISGPTCASPCSAVSFTPSSSFPEGRYTLSVDVKSEEGVPMQKTFHFAAASSSNEVPSATTSSTNCLLPDSSAFSVTTKSGNETVLAHFDYSLSGGTARIRFNKTGDTSAPPVTVGPGSGSQTLSLTIATATTQALTLDYCIASGSGTLDLSNIWVSRAP